ncbi:UNVERIFIED_CONTAM: transcription elongation factor SPT6 [Hammondia hammondi]|eukprot:XP_008888101.1 transcription elongation factor SPT6 [Hammondia hammondi]
MDSPASSSREAEAGGRLRRPSSDEDVPLKVEKRTKKSKKEKKRERASNEKKRRLKARKSSSSRKKKQRFVKDSAREASDEELRRRSSDSSDEESGSDEDAAIAAEMRGFIVSEESGEEEGESDDSEKENEDDGPQQLDDEDLALIEENTGLTVRKQPLRPPFDEGESESEEADEAERSGAARDSEGADGFAALQSEEQRRYRRLKKVEGSVPKSGGDRPEGERGGVSRTREEASESLFFDDDKAENEFGAGTFPALEAPASALDADALSDAGEAVVQGSAGSSLHAKKLLAGRRVSRASASPLGQEDLGEASEEDEAWLEEEDALQDSAAQQRMGETWGLVYDCFGDVDAVVRILCNVKPVKHAASGGEEDEFQGAGDVAEETRRRREGRGREEDEELRGRLGKAAGAKRGKGRASEGWEAIGEPDEVKREFLTSFDEHVRRVDDPERLFLRFIHRPKHTSKAALVLESRWITSRLFREFGAQLTTEELRRRYFDSFFEGCRLRRSPYHDVRQKVILLLDWVLNERLEIVFILHHKLHLIAPPLTEEMVWRVYELDQQFCRLQAKKRRLLELIEEVVDGVALLQGQRQGEETRERLLQMWSLCAERAAGTKSHGSGERGRRREADIAAVDAEEVALEDFRTFLHSHYRQFVVAAREELEKKLAESGEKSDEKREAGDAEEGDGEEGEEQHRGEERGDEREEEDDGLGLESEAREEEREQDWLVKPEDLKTSVDSERQEEDASAPRDGIEASETSSPLSTLPAVPASLASPVLLPHSEADVSSSAAERRVGFITQLDPGLPIPPPPEELLGLVDALVSSRSVGTTGSAQREVAGSRAVGEAVDAGDASLKQTGEDVLAESAQSQAAAPPAFQTDTLLQGRPPSPSSFSYGPASGGCSVHVAAERRQGDLADAEEATPVDDAYLGDVQEGEHRVEARGEDLRALSPASLPRSGRPRAAAGSSVTRGVTAFQHEPALWASPPASPLEGQRNPTEETPVESRAPHSDAAVPPPVQGEKPSETGDTGTVQGGSALSSTWKHRWDAPNATQEPSSSSFASSSLPVEEAGRASASKTSPEGSPRASSWKSRWGVPGSRGNEGTSNEEDRDAGGEVALFAEEEGKGSAEDARRKERLPHGRELRLGEESYKSSVGGFGGGDPRRGRGREGELDSSPEARGRGEEGVDAWLRKDRRDERESERRRDRDERETYDSSETHRVPGDRDRPSRWGMERDRRRRRGEDEERSGGSDERGRRPPSFGPDAHADKPRGAEREAEDETERRLREEDQQAEAAEAAEWERLEREAEEDERKCMLAEREKKIRDLFRRAASGEQPSPRIGRGMHNIPGLEAIELADRYNIFSLWESYLLPPDAFVSNLEALAFTSSAFSPSLFASRFSLLLRPTETPHIPIASSTAISSVLTFSASAFLSQFVPNLFLNTSPDLPCTNAEKLPGLPGDVVANLEAACDAWCAPFCVHPFDSGRQLKRVLIAYYAKILASYPPLRSLVRKRFHQICSMSTLTTVKGEAETDPAKPCWMARRLSRLPLLKFVNEIVPSFEEAPPISPWKDRALRKAEEEARKAAQREHLKQLPSLEAKRAYLAKIQSESREETPSGSMTRARQLETLLKKREDARCLELFLHVHRLEKAGELTLFIHPQTSDELAGAVALQKGFEERHRDFRRAYRSLVIEKGREAPALEALALNRSAADAFGQGVGASLVFDLVKQKRFLDDELAGFARSRTQDAFLVQRLVDDLLAAYSPHLWQAATAAGNIGQHHFASFFCKSRSASSRPGGGPTPAARGGMEDEGEAFVAFLQRGGGNVSAAAAASAVPGWLHIQRRILERVVEVELLPSFKREVREDLLHRAQQVVILRCREMLEWRLNTQPLRPSAEQMRRRQLAGEDEEGTRKSRKRASRDSASEKNSSEESDSFDENASEASSATSLSSEADSSSDEETYVSGAFQTERKRLRAAKRQRKLQKQQRLLERRRRLVQEPALVDVLAFVVENVHEEVSAEMTSFASVGSAADTPVGRAGAGRRGGRSRARVHAMLVNAWGEMEEYDVYEFLLNAPLPSQQEVEGVQNGEPDAREHEASAEVRSTGVSAEQRRAYQDLERLLRFFRDHFVDAAVVGVRDRFALLLYLILKERVVPKLKKKEQPLFLELASLEVPTIWAGSDKAPQVLRQKLLKEGLMCLSLARTLQDPLAEIAGLWSEGRENSLLQLRLHPLQKLVPSDRLQSALERVLLTSVGKVGVELKRALRGSTAALGGNPTAALLQFVPGLGPRKVARLLGMFKTSTLLMRSQLCTPNDGSTSDSDGGRGDLDDFYPPHSQSEKRHAQPVGLGRKVYMNCVSFLRLKNKTSDPESVDALDDTRIHPLEGRNFVAKICRDAVAEKDEAHQTEEEEENGETGGARRRDEDVDDEDAIVEVFRKPALLDDMDLEAFSQMLAETKDQARCLPYLEFITSELRHPYRDPRLPFESASEMEVFFWAIGEDAEEFHPGSSVSCQVVFARNTSLVVRLQPSGIRVQLSDLRELRSLLALRTPQIKQSSPGEERRPHQEDLSPLLGEVLHGRVAFLHYGIELERSGFPTYRIEVVVTGDVVKAMVAQNLVSDVSLNAVHTFLSPAARFDGLAVRRPLTVELEELQLEQQKKHQRLRRNIRHPNYKPVTPMKGLQLLQHAGVPVGEALFRPGTSVEGLTLMVKTCADPFRCLSLPIEERNPLLPTENTPEAFSAMAAALQQQEQLGGVGSELILQGEKFDSLNAIIAQFCDPLRVNLEEVYRHPKYLPMPDLSIAVEKLRQEAASRPGSICWALLPPASPATSAATGRDSRAGNENPLRFQLVVWPPQPPSAGAHPRVLVDGVYVDHKKFSIWNQEHKSLQKLVSWWKEKGYWRRQELLKAYAEEKGRLQAERERRRQEREHLKMLEARREEEERRTQRDYVATYIQPRNEQSAKEWYERAVRRQKNYEPRAAGTVVETGKGGRTPGSFAVHRGGDACVPYSQAPDSLSSYPASSPFSQELDGRPMRRGAAGSAVASPFRPTGFSQASGLHSQAEFFDRGFSGDSQARPHDGRDKRSWSSVSRGGDSQQARNYGSNSWETGEHRTGHDRSSCSDRRPHHRDEGWRREERRTRFGERWDR